MNTSIDTFLSNAVDYDFFLKLSGLRMAITYKLLCIFIDNIAQILHLLIQKPKIKIITNVFSMHTSG